MPTLQALMYIEGNDQTGRPIWNYPQETRHPGKDAKLDRVIQLNCGEVHTHASYKATRTWENFNSHGTKMIVLSDKLWSIANNSKGFANESKSIIRNNLGLYKCSNIRVLARNLQFRLLGPNWEFRSFGARGFRGLLLRPQMGFRVLAIWHLKGSRIDLRQMFVM